MGKIDDMRRLREQQFAETEKRRAAGAKAQPAPAVAPPAPPPKAKASEPAPPQKKQAAAKRGEAEQGKCPECGKMKPLQNGVMASHQKGFGKACAGTRKKPL